MAQTDGRILAGEAMTPDDELRRACWELVHRIEDCIDNNGELYDTEKAIQFVLRLCRQQQANTWREAGKGFADWDDTIDFVAECESKARELEAP
jgi:hypothetical protein